MRHNLMRIGIVLVLGLLWNCEARAQDAGTPQPAVQQNSQRAAQAATSEPTPDTRPLSGAQYLTVGLTTPVHSVLLPSFSVATQVGTVRDPNSSTNGTSLASSTYLSGRLGFNRTTVGSEFLLDYLAGASFSTDSNSGTSGIQSLNISESIRRGRWSFLLGDQLMYTSESPFGFGGLGGLNNLGIGLGTDGSGGIGTTPGFRPGFGPDQSIFANGAPRVSNSVVGQTDYLLTRRSSLTFAGSYGILHFVDSGFENNRSATFQAGYNYALSRKNSIAVFYQFGATRFSNINPSFDSHSAQFSFARRITGRLSFQVGAGPQIQVFHSRLTDSDRSVDLSASAAITYQVGRIATSATYQHSATGGSGIFPGATTDRVEGQASKRFTRDWSGSVSGGYSRNQSFRQTTGAASQFSLNTGFGTVRLSRSFTPGGTLFISYTASRQSDLSGICSLAVCGTNTTMHTGSIGYSWGFRPIVVE